MGVKMSTATLTKARTYGTDEANELLYGNQPSPSFQSVKLENTELQGFASYDTASFDSLKDTKYSTNEFIATEVPLQSQFQAAQPYLQPVSATEFFTNTDLPVFEKYIDQNSTPDVSSTRNQFTFRPHIIDEQNSILQLVDTQLSEPIKIAEVDMEVEHETVTKSPHEHKSKTTTDSVIKLNHKGMIVVGTFLAVLVLVTVLVIINAINLGSSASRLSELRGESAVTYSRLTQAQRDSTDARNNRTYELRRQLNANRNGNNSEIQIGDGSNIQVEYTGNSAVRVPTQSPWRPAENPDASSNWFNALGAWLSGLFR